MTDNALFALDEETRIVRGRLLPFGELSAPSVSGAEPVEFSAEAITVPGDPDVLTFNRHHDRFDPIGRAQAVETREDGVYAEFRIAKTPEGDAALADIKGGKIKALSAEVADLMREGAKAVSARLTGAALVPVGAFAGAHLFAAAEAEDEDLEDGEDAAPETPEATPASDNEKEETVTESIVPETAAGAQATATAPRDDLTALYAAAASRDPEALAAFRGAGEMFAIATVQDSGPSTVTIGADVRQPVALGELWKRRPYVRQYVDLVNHENLTGTRVYGWRWVDGKEPEVNDYTGNTAEVPSNALDTEPVTADAVRIAGGHKLDRRFRDFNDQSVIQSYLRLQTESYARFSDAKALAALVAGATTVTIGDAVSGVDDSLVALIDGARAVIASENTPSFAVVADDVYRTIALTPKDQVFEFLSGGFGLEGGNLAGFRIIPGNVGTGKVLVGAKEAATIYELPGAPIRVEGLDVHHGAIDLAVFGYFASLVNNSKALALVDTDRGGE